MRHKLLYSSQRPQKKFLSHPNPCQQSQVGGARCPSLQAVIRYPQTLNGVVWTRRLGSQDTHHARWCDKPSPHPCPWPQPLQCQSTEIMWGEPRLPPYPAVTRCPSSSPQGQHQRRPRIQTEILPVLSGKEATCPRCPMRPQEDQQ